MTSTNINVGIEGRTSSRVLKPPGGAHTDIFGVRQDRMEVSTSRYSKMSQKSSISECFEYDSPPPASKQVPAKENNEDIKPEVHENGMKNGDELKNGNILENDEVKPTPNLPPVNQRVRVPPGGFSSGLW
ncbi:hypothetical protein ILUMI_23273 [Ignelater luminosus]|uniref:Microtubule-associated protein Jupiter n=1 Tax=Ignelater luminosus TaxID=2038154 RepID=A0A8K0CCR5_IGNLU|nr:hypothetical protein ILUMI_23273 [Ignelater luminosus]